MQENLARKSCRKFLQDRQENANLRNAVIGGNLAFGIGPWGANQSGSTSGKSWLKILRENLVGKYYGKILQENLVGNSCGTGWRGKSQFKKDSDWWKFSIWKRVMGSQPIRIQLKNMLRENVAGKSCGKFLWKFLWENLVGNAAGNLAGNSLGNLVGNSVGNLALNSVGNLT